MIVIVVIANSVMHGWIMLGKYTMTTFVYQKALLVPPVIVYIDVHRMPRFMLWTHGNRSTDTQIFSVRHPQRIAVP